MADALAPIGGRKFILSLVTLVLTFVLAMRTKLSADFATVAAALIATFNGANAYISGKTAGFEVEELPDAAATFRV